MEKKNQKLKYGLLGGVIAIAVVIILQLVMSPNVTLQGTLTSGSPNCPVEWTKVSEIGQQFKGNEPKFVELTKEAFDNGCQFLVRDVTDPDYVVNYNCEVSALVHFSTRRGMFPVSSFQCYNESGVSYINIDVETKSINGYSGISGNWNSSMELYVKR